MAVPYIDLTTHTRARGHSAGAAIAYRRGLTLRDSRTGEYHDYAHRLATDSIGPTGVIASRPTPLAHDMQLLADEIETKERHPRARILRDLTVGHGPLPVELQTNVSEQLALAIAHRYDTLCAWFVHAPGEQGDHRNAHTHLVIPTRSLTEEGALGQKIRVLDNPRTSGDEVAWMRNTFAKIANEALEAAESDERIEPGRILVGIPVEDADTALVNAARKSVAKRTGTKVKGLAAREAIEMAVAAGDLDSDRARRISEQHVRAKEWSQTTGQVPRYASRAVSRRSEWMRKKGIARSPEEEAAEAARTAAAEAAAAEAATRIHDATEDQESKKTRRIRHPRTRGVPGQPKRKRRRRPDRPRDETVGAPAQGLVEAAFAVPEEPERLPTGTAEGTVNPPESPVTSPPVPAPEKAPETPTTGPPDEVSHEILDDLRDIGIDLVPEPAHARGEDGDQGSHDEAEPDVVEEFLHTSAALDEILHGDPAQRTEEPPAPPADQLEIARTYLAGDPRLGRVALADEIDLAVQEHLRGETLDPSDLCEYWAPTSRDGSQDPTTNSSPTLSATAALVAAYESVRAARRIAQATYGRDTVPPRHEWPGETAQIRDRARTRAIDRALAAWNDRKRTIVDKIITGILPWEVRAHQHRAPFTGQPNERVRAKLERTLAAERTSDSAAAAILAAHPPTSEERRHAARYALAGDQGRPSIRDEIHRAVHDHLADSEAVDEQALVRRWWPQTEDRSPDPWANTGPLLSPTSARRAARLTVQYAKRLPRDPDAARERWTEIAADVVAAIVGAILGLEILAWRANPQVRARGTYTREEQTFLTSVWGIIIGCLTAKIEPPVPGRDQVGRDRRDDTP